MVAGVMTLPDRSSVQYDNIVQIRIRNLVAISTTLNEQIGELAASATTGRALAASRAKRRMALLEEARQQASSVEQICRLAGSTPAGLAGPSRRAYHWLKYLSSPAHLDSHLASLVTMIKLGQRAEFVQSLPARLRPLPIKISLYNIPGLYRARLLRDSIQLVAHEGFAEAPLEVLEALLCAALLPGGRPRLAQVKAYADRRAFTRVARALESSPEEAETQAAGQNYNLKALFDRINAAYFEAQLEQPRLTWNRALTRRKFGHYQPNTDTVMISTSLDQKSVPVYVVEFVLHHEMLHKKLGLQVKNGRRYGHTAQFRQEERKFARYTEAQEYLDKIANGKKKTQRKKRQKK